MEKYCSTCVIKDCITRHEIGSCFKWRIGAPPKPKTLIDKNKLIDGLTEVDKIMGLKNLLPLLIQIIENQETYS